NALLQRGVQAGRAAVLAQQVAERLVGKLLDTLEGIASEQVKRLPALGIEFDQFAMRSIRLLRHDPLRRESPPHSAGTPSIASAGCACRAGLVSTRPNRRAATIARPATVVPAARSTK